jgi:protein-disulfide isomerase
MTLAVPVMKSDHIRGPFNAPVTLLEYGDYECPYCGMAFPVVNRVLQHFGPRLRFVFRHFPLTQVHPNAEHAAEAAEFAGAHNLFWEMHEGIYMNQAMLGTPLLVSLATSLGLSKERLVQAIADHQYAEKIRQDFMGGVRSGVNGTPTFFIDDRRHDGGFDFNILVAAIEAQLVKAAP